MTTHYILGGSQSLQFALLQVRYPEDKKTGERYLRKFETNTDYLGLWEFSPSLLFELSCFW